MIQNRWQKRWDKWKKRHRIIHIQVRSSSGSLKQLSTHEETPSVPPKTNSIIPGPVDVEVVARGYGIRRKQARKTVSKIKVLLTLELSKSMIYNCNYIVDLIFSELNEIINFNDLHSFMCTAMEMGKAPLYSVSEKVWKTWPRAKRKYKPAEKERAIVEVFKAMVEAAISYLEQ